MQNNKEKRAQESRLRYCAHIKAGRCGKCGKRRGKGGTDTLCKKCAKKARLRIRKMRGSRPWVKGKAGRPPKGRA